MQTDGHLSIEFTFDEYMRIRSWKFNIKDNMELVPKSSLLDCKTDQTKLEELAANVTEHGFSKATLQYLRVHLNNSCSLRSFFLPVSQAKYQTSYFRIGLVSCLIFMFIFLLAVIFLLIISAFQI